jgi:1A family penicillin-binding protein
MIHIVKSLRIILLKILLFFAKFLIHIGYVIIFIPEQMYRLVKKTRGWFLHFFNLSIRNSYQKISRIIASGVVNSRIVGEGMENVKKKSKKKKKKTNKHSEKYSKPIIKARVFILGVAFTLFFIVAPLRVYSWYRELPNPDLLVDKGNNRPTRILDRNGQLLYEIYSDRRYDPVSLDQIPPHVIQSTLAIEDSEFFNHRGFRPLSIMRAAKATILHDELQGGSTITQQLVKNVLLTPERTIERKLKELVLATMVEHKYTKEEILELYFNNIPYGGTAWGVQSASHKYFGKNVWDLDLAEATMLAGLPNAPTAYSPFNGNYEISKLRQRIVLNRMVAMNYISDEEANTAFKQDLVYAPQEDFIRAPHFVFYVRNELEKHFGPRFVTFGGLTVTTTLDIDLHDQVQRIVREEIEKSSDLNINNGAAVVLDPETGAILAYVGSKNYFDENWGAFDVLTSLRQPGSAIKPVTYSLAFEQGLTPATIIEDRPVVYRYEGEVYRPVNYDRRFHGSISLRSALANSYNIPAVKLVDLLGPDNMVNLAKDMGLQSWSVDGNYGIAITLGGRDVRPLDLANVYATLARGGVYKDVTPFVSIKDVNGHELYRGYSRQKRVMSPEVAYIVTDILADNFARIPAFGFNNMLAIRGHTVAVKTGTTDQKRDNLAYGYTPSYVVGVWVGNNDNTPMNPRLTSGLSGAAPIWHNIMAYLLEGKENEIFDVPSGIVVKFDQECNRREVFVRGSSIPETLCVKDDDDEDEDKDKKDKKDKKDDKKNEKRASDR